MSKCPNCVSLQTARDNDHKRMRESIRCGICTQLPNKPVVIECGHTFCIHCIASWFQTSQATNCPLCKETVSVSALHPNMIAQDMKNVVTGRNDPYTTRTESADDRPRLHAIKQCELELRRFIAQSEPLHSNASRVYEHSDISILEEAISRLPTAYAHQLELVRPGVSSMNDDDDVRPHVRFIPQSTPDTSPLHAAPSVMANVTVRGLRRAGQPSAAATGSHRQGPQPTQERGQ